MVNVREMESYKDFGKVIAVDNGTVEAYVTVDVGPRIIRYGFIGGQNLMQDDRKLLGSLTDEKYEDFYGEGKAWENLGGHRIWLSPESYPETYYPDLNPVEYRIEPDGNTVSFYPPFEAENSVFKELIVTLPEDRDNALLVTMRATNIGTKPLRFSIWGLTVSAQGGTEIIPMNTDDTGVLSNRTIVAWPYTDMGDARVHWTNKYVTLKQDPAAEKPFKLGFDLKGGEVHYLLNGEVFTKFYMTHHPDSVYPDNGCSFETYTNPNFIEIESLSPLCDVAPGSRSESTELWLLRKAPEGSPDLTTDAGIDAFLEQL